MQEARRTGSRRAASSSCSQQRPRRPVSWSPFWSWVGICSSVPAASPACEGMVACKMQGLMSAYVRQLCSVAGHRCGRYGHCAHRHRRAGAARLLSWAAKGVPKPRRPALLGRHRCLRLTRQRSLHLGPETEHMSRPCMHLMGVSCRRGRPSRGEPAVWHSSRGLACRREAGWSGG